MLTCFAVLVFNPGHMPLLEIRDLKKGYRTPEGSHLPVVEVERFDLGERAEVALAGESGTGKTTFLNLIAGILLPDAGNVQIAGQALGALPEGQRDRFRGRHIGYIFQTFNLLQGFTCLENVCLAMACGAGVDRAQAVQLLERVGLKHRLDYYPRQLSTGQQQRAAVARALANRPRLVLADEPTGNLDARHGKQVLELVRETCREQEAALLLVSHDRDVLAAFGGSISFAELNRARGTSEALEGANGN